MTDPLAAAAGWARSVPLRVKLVAAVLALVSLALGVIGVGSALALRSYLVGQVDTALREQGPRLNVAGLIRPDLGQTLMPPSDYAVALLDPGGRVAVGDYGRPELLFSPGRFSERDLPRWPADPQRLTTQLGQPYTDRGQNDRVRWRILVTRNGDAGYLVVARSLQETDAAVAQLVWIDILVGAGVLLLLASIGAAIIQASLRPLVQIERTAGAIAAGDLSRRVPDPEPGVDPPATELGRLSRALNIMLTQIEAGFAASAASAAAARESETRAVNSEERMRRFVADASHELRTPLTTIRGFAELHRQGMGADPAESARLVRRIEDEAARMGLLVEDLLLLARLDQQRPLERNPVELAVLAADAVQAAHATAPERPIRLDLTADAADVVVLGDDARLRQVLANLMTNALNHTPPEASVVLRLVRAGPTVLVEVADTGPGMAAEHAQRVFERFYRADAARSRRPGPVAGAGLGLAIVAAIVAAHSGTVEVDTAPGEGTTFRVRLPLLAPDADPNPDQLSANSQG
ncbi:sensor histidine kinase [Pilimelia columellifera]|uniref:histidine kinase n=1 Tax=Pilimelia columellifera subsp. columellifera TaxID=706583 RepID=A0ABN3N719_9ACTN